MAETGQIERGTGGAVIDLSDPANLQGWSRELAVSEFELQAAVEKVGPVAEDVRRFLRK